MKWKHGSFDFEWIIRYLAVILGLVLCLVVEWEILDRFTEKAYAVRYEEALEQFRQSPVDYFRFHSIKEDYDNFFAARLEAVQNDLECFPVEKSYIQDISYVDSWYGERSFGGERRHEGTDIMSLTNVSGEIPVISMTDGRVKNIGWLKLGGWRIGIESENGIYYYYAHLHSYAGNIKQGDLVYAGQLLGFMGDSGYGEEGTTGMFDVHLHVGLYFYDTDGREISMNPYCFLQEVQGNSVNTLK